MLGLLNEAQGERRREEIPVTLHTGRLSFIGSVRNMVRQRQWEMIQTQEEGAAGEYASLILGNATTIQI